MSAIQRSVLFVVFLSTAASAPAQVTEQRLVYANREPGNWLTYSGTYNSQRHSRLTQIDRSNVAKLRIEWIYQLRTLAKVETSPLVIDEVMYVTGPTNEVMALDTRTGRPYWTSSRSLPDQLRLCCGKNNRGVAALGDKVFLGTLDAHLIALDAKTGALIWDVEVADEKLGFSKTGAPLAVKDMIITGIAGGEFGIRGFIDAYDAETGERIWRTHTIPGPGEPGNDTWEGDSWKRGGSPSWVTGSYDPELNLLYWGTGNPGPDWNGDVRKGDNLYSDCVLALNPDTGEIIWHFQFTPHDVHDWDACQVPILADAEFEGRPRKLLLWANRNAFFYVLDRETGEFLLARQYAKQTWAKEIDATGRPVRLPNTSPTPEGTVVYPSVNGASNWWSPSYSPRTGLMYVMSFDGADTYYLGEAIYRPGLQYLGSFPEAREFVTGALGNWPADHKSFLRAIEPQTGRIKWAYELKPKSMAGVMTTAANLVFSGSAEGYFFALDAETGKLLWRMNLGGRIIAAPITFLSEGKQHVSIAAGGSIFTFALGE